MADPESNPEQETRSLDDVIAELEDVVDALESGELGLEEALARFEAGVKLARNGRSMLDALEERVEVLLNERGDTKPFSKPER